MTTPEEYQDLIKAIAERDQTIKELREDLKEQQEAFTSMTSNATAFKFWQELKSKNEELREALKTILPIAEAYYSFNEIEADKIATENARKLIEP